MLEKFKSGLDDMAVAITLWLCTLPVVGLLVVPFFGLKAGLIVAAALFIAAMLCAGAFAPGKYSNREASRSAGFILRPKCGIRVSARNLLVVINHQEQQ